MRVALLLFIICESLFAGSVFVSPVANFKTNTISISFLPDIGQSMIVQKCDVVKKKEIIHTIDLQQKLHPQVTIVKVERSFSFPLFIKKVSDLDGTELKCSPGNYKIATWRLEGAYE